MTRHIAKILIKPLQRDYKNIRHKEHKDNNGYLQDSELEMAHAFLRIYEDLYTEQTDEK